MRSIIPRPFLLALTLVVVAGGIAFIELRLDATGAATPQASADRGPDAARQRNEAKVQPENAGARGTSGLAGSDPADTRDHMAPNSRMKVERISRKRLEFDRAKEIVNPSGFVNAQDFSVDAARGEKVILLDFWTYSCINCQHTQPYINRWHERYAEDGLQVVGIHTPEFGFERDYDNVERAVREAGIEYPVVLDNSYATWNAYDQRYWPAWYLIDADGFIRYRHFGEGAYGETEAKIRNLLAERDRIRNE